MNYEVCECCGKPKRPKQTAKRWPANVIHDGSDEVVGLFPVTTSGGGNKSRRGNTAHNNCYGTYNAPPPDIRDVDTGSAARFFYCAKASKRDRDEGLEGMEERVICITEGHGRGAINTSKGDGAGIRENRPRKNTHPTVKPTELCRYLVRLVTPADGVILDPFMGSGSTGKAAMLEGFRFVGIELEPEYLEIARRRIEHAERRIAQAQAQPPLIPHETAPQPVQNGLLEDAVLP